MNQNGYSGRFFVRIAIWERRAYGDGGNQVRKMFQKPKSNLIVAENPTTSYGKSPKLLEYALS